MSKKSYLKKAKKSLDNIWEIPFFYKLLQTTLVGGGHKVMKQFLIKRVPKSARTILDQGCGTGEYSLLFGNKYTGLDNNRKDIEYANKTYPGKFIVGNAAQMSVLKDNSFDVVFSVGLFHHLPDTPAKQAIKEARRGKR